MRARFSEQELAKLVDSELSPQAVRLYMTHLRPKMDYATGIVGQVAKISLQSCAEHLEYRPPKGSKADPISPNVEYVRARLAELERHGLIIPQPKERKTDPISFFLPLADKDRPQEEPQMNPKGGTPNENGVTMRVNGHTNPRGTPKDEPHTSGSPVKSIKNTSCSLSRTDVPDCPHQQIRDIYHEVLPECPRVNAMDAIMPNLRTRWREKDAHQSLEFWRWYFGRCRDTFWFSGRNDRSPPGLMTMVRKKNFYGVINGDYDA